MDSDPREWTVASPTTSSSHRPGEESPVDAAETDVTVLRSRVRELEEALAQTRAELDDCHRQWAGWLAMISHDLRSPLTLVLGYAQNLLRRPPLESSREDERLRHELGAIISGARRVDKMISQIVDGARLDADALRLESREVDLVALVREEVRKARRIYPEHVFRTDVSDPLPLAFTDNRRASQIVASLLSNAALHSPADRPILIRIGRKGNRIVIAVQDRGIGLTETERGHLFERAYQSERTRDIRREGIGLSLVNARRIVEKSGGEIWAESPGEDRGSTFFLALPIAAANDQPLE